MGFARNLAKVPNSPAFSAVPSGTQSIGVATQTKLTFATEEFDTNSNYDNTTNYRFQPTVAGYYQVNLGIQLAGGQTVLIGYIYKNGSNFKSASRDSATANQTTLTTSALVYLNGSTDYIEAFIYTSASATVTNAGQWNFFQAHLARAA